MHCYSAPRDDAPTDGPEGSPLVLYNTMSRSKEVFTPSDPAGKHVSMYVCGVTVYDYSHIGHARVYVAFDVLLRVLESKGYDVQYVRNFTDIDDKIIARAAELREEPAALTERFIQAFEEDLSALGCRPPSLQPRATAHVAGMVTTIERILQNGHAYAVEGGDVFFDVRSLPQYGRLSGRKLDDNRAGERVQVDDRKRDAADFALWKAAKPGEPTWDSPWGLGRPGWHIECSSMIREIMGPCIDIHGGGSDLQFPHHENEIAQSQAAASCCSDKDAMHNGGLDFVRYWLHNGFVKVDSDKMSKSLGNFFTIREVLESYHPLVLRWFLVGTQYRQSVNYSQRSLEEASERAFYVYQTLHEASEVLSDAGEEGQAAWLDSLGDEDGQATLRSVQDALYDDLNTPLALAHVCHPLGALNDLMHTKKGRKKPGRLASIAGAVRAISSGLELLGLHTSEPDRALEGMRVLALKRADLTEEAVRARIEERAAARAAKDFAAADAVRDELVEVGIGIMDGPTGTTWRPTLRPEAAAQPTAAL